MSYYLYKYVAPKWRNGLYRISVARSVGWCNTVFLFVICCDIVPPRSFDPHVGVRSAVFLPLRMCNFDLLRDLLSHIPLNSCLMFRLRVSRFPHSAHRLGTLRANFRSFIAFLLPGLHMRNGGRYCILLYAFYVMVAICFCLLVARSDRSYKGFSRSAFVQSMSIVSWPVAVGAKGRRIWMFLASEDDSETTPRFRPKGTPAYVS